jgi:hypothetical protein
MPWRPAAKSAELGAEPWGQILQGPATYWSDWISAKSTSASIWNTLNAADLNFKAKLLALGLEDWGKKNGIKVTTTVTDLGAMQGYSLFVTAEIPAGKRIEWTPEQIERSRIVWYESKTAAPPTPALVHDDQRIVEWQDVPADITEKTIDAISESVGFKGFGIALGVGAALWLLSWLPKRNKG